MLFHKYFNWALQLRVEYNICQMSPRGVNICPKLCTPEVPKLFFLIDHFKNFAGSGGPPAESFIPYSQNSTKNV